jgi:hypothetical protein
MKALVGLVQPDRPSGCFCLADEYNNVEKVWMWMWVMFLGDSQNVVFF